MSTLTERQREDFLRQLSDIQNRLNDIRSRQSGGLNAAQQSGAAGRGADNIDAETSAAIDRATQAGVPMSELGTPTGDGDETLLDAPEKLDRVLPPPRLSGAQSARFVSSFGLEGILDAGAVSGLTAQEANQRLLQEKARRTGQVSANTTFTFNPETLRRTQRQIDNFGFALDDIDNDPFEPQEFKDEERQNAIEVASRELGKLFDSPQQLFEAAQFDQGFASVLNQFVERGGSIDGIAKNITAPVPVNGAEDPASYLANINNPAANPQAEEMALNELMPETAIAQAEISRIARIPEELQTLYFGDEKQLGIYQMRQKQAEEEVRIIEEKERDAKNTARDRADLTIDKNNAEAKKLKNQVEENRLQAKNYITARLAKLGALKTSGVSPVAIKTLDAKYDQQVTQIEQTYAFANRELEIGLTEALNNIENTADTNILKIQENLTLDAEKMAKEVLKAQQAADEDVYKITEQYARRLRERTTKYSSDLKKEAEKYAAAYAKTVSTSAAAAALLEGRSGMREGDFDPKTESVLMPDGSMQQLDLSPTESRQIQRAQLLGAGTMQAFIGLPNAYRNYRLSSVASGEARTFQSPEDVRSDFAWWQDQQDNDDSSSSSSSSEQEFNIDYNTLGQ